MIYQLVTVLCLAILCVGLIYVLKNFISKARPEKIAFLRSFRKGKGAIIYVTAIPLYLIGYLHAGQKFLPALFGSITESVQLIVLGYKIANIQGLMQENPLYNFTIYFTFVLVTINAVIFTLSLTHQHIWCFFQSLKAKATRKDKLFIFGNNPENISIYRSDDKRSKVIIDNVSPQESEKLYMHRISFISTDSCEEPVSDIFKVATKFDRECVVVVNTLDDEKNINICRSIIDKIAVADDNVKDRLFLNTKIFVFGNPKYKAIYDDIVSGGFGCIHYVNKYQKIAMDFIDKYPLTKFMDEKQIDYDSFLVKDGVDINVLFVGFGKTAQQIFLTSVANNQFLTKGASDPELKKVNYYIFDKAEAENNKNLNHSYYRYKHECSSLDPKDYLPLPDHPAEEKYFRLDINDPKFYTQIMNVAKGNPNNSNFIVIAFGSDLENIDMAQKLVEKRKEWGIENLVIFVKVRNWHKEDTMIGDSGCYFFGYEKDVVYNIDKIIGDRIFRMAQMRNEVYELEYAIHSTPDIVVDAECIKKNHDAAYRGWHTAKSQLERESSLYCCLSLRSKLNLMGLDYCEKESDRGVALSESEYMAIYAGNDLPDTSKYSVTADGKPIVNYTLDFPVSGRRTMAIHEHLRWNSFMISKGIIPSSRAQIEGEKTVKNGKERFTNGKNYAVRRHGNLTTFEGLVEFRKILAARDKSSELDKDVIKYDYQLLDDAYWLLDAAGYKIIKNVKLV